VSRPRLKALERRLRGDAEQDERVLDKERAQALKDAAREEREQSREAAREERAQSKEAAQREKAEAKLKLAANEQAAAPEKAVDLHPQQRRVLDLMRADNRDAGEPFRATDYWIDMNARFDEWFAKQGIADLESQPFNALFSAPPRGSGKYYTYAVTMLYRHLLARDEHGVLDRAHAHGSTKTVLQFGEHRVSWEHLLSINTLYSIAEVEPRVWTEPVVIADLGAGWGRIGHVLELVNPQATYIDFDLPEALLVASAFLPPLLPDARIVGYEEGRGADLTRDLLLAEPAVRFCATQDLARVEPGAIDVLVNIASFQEMTREQVQAYLQITDRVARGAVLEERWKRPPGFEGRVIAGYEDYAFPPGWESCFLREALFSDEFFETGYTIRG
jgi:hypothetical protein